MIGNSNIQTAQFDTPSMARKTYHDWLRSAHPDKNNGEGNDVFVKGREIWEQFFKKQGM